MRFSQFELGQYVSLKRVFSSRDYESFKDLSWDSNPLHWNAAFSNSSEFSQPIVPLALAVSPFSAIAGLSFPGIPSLILTTTYEAHKHVCYDRSLTYSARIAHIVPEKKVLQLDLRVFDGSERLIAGRMTVQARFGEWEIPLDQAPDFEVKQPGKIAFVTGGDGTIGAACASQLERIGWTVVRHSRRRCTPGFIAAELAHADERQALANAIAEIQPSLIVHCASAGVQAPLNELIQTNYQTLKLVTEAALPHMCEMQHGRIINVGSITQLNAPPELTDYAGAKEMAYWYLSQIDRRYRNSGINAVTLLCDQTHSAFSHGLQSLTGVPLEPEEVAESIADIAERRDCPISPKYVLTSMGLVAYENDLAPSVSQSKAIVTESPTSVLIAKDLPSDIRERLRSLINQILPDSIGMPDSQLRIDSVAGWDSMTQISLALEVEQQFGIALTSAAISELISFDALHRAVGAAAQ
ncbi:SDR family NAD(P)-dependent oxidoreductase [Agrobacterium rhizogenes]|nr:SDR family NAD(P)-dependent oxidoreductase [Rhizobium rhizogenes]NTH53725.1 SDR family NAD(P)-dependent oxidoreductase [Rhizobium rhizogenes]NTH73309.1 SDR family NAD(P)-dependent oxidoreductase [Rhizobium rhizogenes]